MLFVPLDPRQYVAGAELANDSNWKDLQRYNDVQAGQLQNLLNFETFSPVVNQAFDAADRSRLNLRTQQAFAPGDLAQGAAYSNAMNMFADPLLQQQIALQQAQNLFNSNLYGANNQLWDTGIPQQARLAAQQAQLAQYQALIGLLPGSQQSGGALNPAFSAAASATGIPYTPSVTGPAPQPTQPVQPTFQGSGTGVTGMLLDPNYDWNGGEPEFLTPEDLARQQDLYYGLVQ